MNKNYFFKFLIILLLVLKTNFTFSNENKVLFKILNNSYTSIDFEIRKKYIKFVGENDNIDSEEILKDYISSQIFYNYFKRNNIKIDLDNKIENIYENIINAKNINLSISDEDKINIFNNLKYDLIRKTILENFLNNKKNEININRNDINLMYRYKIKYINVNLDDLSKHENFKDIYNYKNIFKIENELKKRNIPFFVNEKEIPDIDLINNEIKSEIYSKNYFFNIKKGKMLSFILIKKNFETTEGLIIKLYSFNSKDLVDNNVLDCSRLNNNVNVIKKEYEYSKLNNKIKDSLIDINDYVKFENENIFTYIVLCGINFDKELFSNIKINKKINTIVTKIEENFVNKYSKIYKLKLADE